MEKFYFKEDFKIVKIIELKLIEETYGQFVRVIVKKKEDGEPSIFDFTNNWLQTERPTVGEYLIYKKGEEHNETRCFTASERVYHQLFRERGRMYEKRMEEVADYLNREANKYFFRRENL